MIKKNNIITAVIILIAALFLPAASMAAITGVYVTAADPTPVSGDPYYLASRSTYYEFIVTVTDPAAAARDYYDHVDLVIPLAGGNTITARWNADAGNGTFVLQAGSYGASKIASADGTTVSGTTTLTLRFRITFAWDIPLNHNSMPGLKTITATAYDDAPSNMSGSTSISYGFCNQVKINNFAQNGEASDGMVNPYSAFNVTGQIYYNITGASLPLTGADINTVKLYRDAAATSFSNTGAAPDFSFLVNPEGSTLGGFNWRIEVTLNNPNASTNQLFAANTLPCTYDRVQITSIEISNPGNAGRIDGDTHWRSTIVPGTTITINAKMQNSGANMQGDTIFRINNGSTDWDVTILNGATSGTFVIPSSAPDMITESGSDTYTITRIDNPYYGVQAGDVQIRDTNYPPPAPETQYANQLVWWDNADAPNGGTALTNGDEPRRSAASATIYWEPVNTSTTSADGNFYEYRVYIRETAGGTCRQWNGNNDPLLRDTAPGAIVNNPHGSASEALHFTSDGQKYTTVTGLKAFTKYEYYITAVDIFGNETPEPGTIKDFMTTPYSVEAMVSDGITSIPNTTFADGPTGYANADRQLRETGIRVALRIVTSAGEGPDTVKVWFTNNLNIDIIDIPSNTVNVALFTDPNILEWAEARKTAPNEWVAYLPSESAIINDGNCVRFIVETTKGGASVFSDWQTDDDNEFNNEFEWAFSIAAGTVFTPWPTRMLNNVITKDNPVAYPSYYLTDDAYVTITAYDIKGRPVAVLLENAWRPAGQNIKEDGWAGTNKNKKKLGVGLYYIRIFAKRASDGKVIIDKYSKVVVSK